MTSQSIQTLRLVDNSAIAKNVNVSVSAELMENYMAGRSYSAEHPIAVAYNSNGDPMLFTIGSTNEFSVIVRQENTATGWQQINLSAPLGDNRVAQQFAILQSANGDLFIALAMESRTLAGSSELYVAQAISNNPKVTKWASFGSQWAARPFDKGNLTISEITISNDIDTGVPIVVVATKQQGKDAAHWIIKDTSTDGGFWQPYALPTNPSNIIDMVFGSHPLGQGVYTLYHSGSGVILAFTTLDGSYTVGLTPPSGATKLAILPDTQELSDLYVAGDGLYIFKSSNQLSGARAETVATSQAFPRTQDLIVCQDTQNIAIWARTADGNLLYTTAKKANQLAWSQPITLRTGVAQIAPLRNQKRMTNEIFLVGADNKTLGYLWQDPATTLWKETDLSLPDSGKVIHFNSYVTHIELSDADHVPLTDMDVEITASEWVYATINGVDRVVDSSHPVTVKPNLQGAIAIANKVSTIATPTFHVKVTPNQVVDVNPAAKLKSGLSSIKQGDDWLNQKTQTGKPLLKQNYSQSTRDTAAQAVQQLVDMTDTLPQGNRAVAPPLKGLAVARSEDEPASNRINVSHLENDYCWGVHFDEDASKFLSATEVRQFLIPSPIQSGETAVLARVAASDVSNAITAIAGDIFEALEHGVEKAKSFFVKVKDKVTEFFIDLGDRIVKFVLECVEQVFRAINWLLKELLGIDLQTLIDWLGFRFNWDEILCTHNALRAVTTIGFNHMMQEVNLLEDKIRDAFATVRQHVIGNDLPDSRSNEIFGKRPKQSMQGQDRSHLSTPQGNWAHHALFNNLDSATAGTLEVAGELSQVLINTLKTEGEIIENAMQEVVNDIAANIDQLSFGDILEKLAKIVAESVINSVENVALSFVELAEVLANAMWTLLNARWDIPLITPLYEKIIAPGSQLTLLDLICLISSIPSTIIFKLAHHRPLFTKQEAKAFGDAKSFQDLLGIIGVSLQPHSPRPSNNLSFVVADAAQSPTQKEKNLAAIQDPFAILMGGSRLISGIAYGFMEAEAFDPSSKGPNSLKGKCQIFKFASDLVTYALSVINAGIYIATNKPLSLRQKIDTRLQFLQGLLRGKDIVLLFVDDQFAEPLAWFETAFGAISAILVGVSTGLQDHEDPSKGTPQLNKQDAQALLAMKATQSFSTCVCQYLSGPKMLAHQEVESGNEPAIIVEKGIIATRVFFAALVIPTFNFARASRNLELNRQYLDF